MKKQMITWITGALLIPGLLSAQESIDGRAGITPTPDDQVRNYVVASPRISLQTHPRIPDLSPTLDRCRVVGAAHNFHRESARLVMLRDQKLFVKLDDETEGVWHPKSCGFLGAGLFMYQYDFYNQGWRKLGHDMRYARSCGPNKGQGTDIGVFFKASRVGTHILNARAISFALPTDPNEPENIRKWLKCGDIDISRSYIVVWVVDSIEPHHRDWEAFRDVEPIDGRTEIPKGEISVDIEPGVFAVEPEALFGLEAVPVE